LGGVPWFSRSVLIGITVTYALVGRWLAIDHAGVARPAVTLAFAAATEMPAGIGASLLGCALILVGCILAARRHLAGLTVAATLLGAILCIRMCGILVGGAFAEPSCLLAVEGLFFALSLLAIRAERSRERHLAYLYELIWP
jgi:hypothetical protein